MAEVIVIGAGPVGLLLGGLLRRAGVDVEILEQREHGSADSRAIGIHAPVLAALEDSGLTARLLEQAVQVTRGEARAQGNLLGVVRFDRLSTRFPFVATLPQSGTEAALAHHAPAPQRGIAVSALRPESDHVELDTSSGTRRAPLVVLAGGPRSRELVYRSPVAHSYPDRYLMTDVEAPGAQGRGTQMPARQDAHTALVHLEPSGVVESFPLPGGRRRFVAWDSGVTSEDPASQRDRMARTLAAHGQPLTGAVSGFGVRRFVAPALRRHRLLVIGDAAHEVSPIGGQGMNLGLLDAATLAPLLTDWVTTGTEPEAQLRHWERTRLGSARRAAQLAALNTRLGRPLPPARDSARRNGVRLMLGPGSGRLFAHAYAMGLDAEA
ncbi:FAD-dependent monooxygenase [Nesterenkonia sp. E16_7]|uniref:FAD-dependent monooxygenase n=1 Tax=unclassified Nesterenkonia TaxID=2629769 RepID=UPI001A9246DB|nr:FAD-dependent monooxygenase [Nesterenkonia sp. E16_10]MBO0597868.1 FAD-dependent monooxygenase [Nesterenkonia sp. E16_7]